jgi:hypothetical protein
MTTYTRKAWSIVAYTWQGSIYCLECSARGLMNLELTREAGTDQPAPVFASDEHTLNTCDTCRNPIQQ